MTDSGFLARAALQTLLTLLTDEGYRCIGPQVREGAIVFAPLTSVEALPLGVHDAQAPGHYRLTRDDSPRHFAWANGPQALKPLLFASRETLWRARSQEEALRFSPVLPEPEPLAVIGLRACDLAALALHDAHFLGGVAPDTHYARRREGLFLIAVDCSAPADTCFCASTGDGPQLTAGYDLGLHELDDGYLLRAGSELGRAVLAQLPLTPVSEAQRAQAGKENTAAVRRQQRRLPGRHLQAPLFANLDHARWEQVGERCLACGNCTSVCPTCFCHSEGDEQSLDGAESEHYRQWDSCFSEGHSALHGIPIRGETRLRYRQWMTHKLGSWHEQFGRSGCVGCGRCITWCPVGIDITEEAAAICG